MLLNGRISVRRYLFALTVALAFIGQTLFYTKADLIIAGENDLIVVHKIATIEVEV